MKKISFVWIIILVFSMMQMFSVTTYAEENKTVKYDIQIEALSDSNDAKILNKNRRKLLELFNIAADQKIKETKDSSYSYLTLDDLDFTDNSKITGIKIHSIYDDYEPWAKYETFMEVLEEHYWYGMIEKNDTVYFFAVFNSDSNIEIMPGANSIQINGWIFIASSVQKTDDAYDSTYNQSCRYKPEVIRSNLKRLLKEEKENGTDIKIVFTVLPDRFRSDYGIVFVDNTAKYIYAYGMDYPISTDDFSKDTPQAALDFFNAIDKTIPFNNYDGDSLKIKNLYSYNVIMAMYRFCEHYRAPWTKSE